MERPESPAIVLPTSDGQKVTLHWYNSRLRTFMDSQYDHIELYEDDVTRGLRVGRVVMDKMCELHYPMQFDPVVDDSTFEWFIQSEARVMERELNAGLGPDGLV